MPITFEAPSPVGAAASIYRNGANNSGLSEQYDAEMRNRAAAAGQQASLMAQGRNFRDTQQQQQGEFAASRYYSPRDEGQAQAQMAEQQQRAQLQAQIQQEDFSHADNVRLSELKQGQNEILKQADQGQITGAERDRMLLQLRTGGRGINVLNDRQQQTQIKHQDLVNKQIKQATQLALEDSESKGKLEEARLAYSTAKLQNKITFIPDSQALAEVTAQILRDLPDAPPGEVQQMAVEQLQMEGRGQQMFADAKGQPTVVKAEHLSAGDGSSRSSKGSAPRDFDTMKARTEAIHAVQKGLTDGSIKPEEAQAKQQELYDRFRQDHEDHHNDLATKAGATKAAPFDITNPKAGTDDQRKQIGRLAEKVGEYRDRTDLPPQVQQGAMRDAATAARLSAQWLTPQGVLDPKTPPHIRKELDKIGARLAKIPPAGSTQVQVGLGRQIQGGAPPGSPAALLQRLHEIQAQERGGAAPLPAAQPGGPQFAAPDDPRYGQTQGQTGYRSPGERLDRLGTQLGEAAGNVRQDIGKWLRDY